METSARPDNPQTGYNLNALSEPVRRAAERLKEALRSRGINSSLILPIQTSIISALLAISPQIRAEHIANAQATVNRTLENGPQTEEICRTIEEYVREVSTVIESTNNGPNDNQNENNTPQQNPNPENNGVDAAPETTQTSNEDKPSPARRFFNWMKKGVSGIGKGIGRGFNAIGNGIGNGYGKLVSGWRNIGINRSGIREGENRFISYSGEHNPSPKGFFGSIKGMFSHLIRDPLENLFFHPIDRVALTPIQRFGQALQGLFGVEKDNPRGFKKRSASLLAATLSPVRAALNLPTFLTGGIYGCILGATNAILQPFESLKDKNILGKILCKVIRGPRRVLVTGGKLIDGLGKLVGLPINIIQDELIKWAYKPDEIIERAIHPDTGRVITTNELPVTVAATDDEEKTGASLPNSTSSDSNTSAAA